MNDSDPVPSRPSCPAAAGEAALREGVDYTLDAQGRCVFTANFLRRRGTCCGSLCRNCPFHWENVPAPLLARGGGENRR